MMAPCEACEMGSTRSEGVCAKGTKFAVGAAMPNGHPEKLSKIGCNRRTKKNNQKG